ncbi:MAG: hypothetical protein ACE5J2_08795 [Nitrososphaerales archaeon]
MIFGTSSKAQQLKKMEDEIRELREKNEHLFNKIERLRVELSNVTALRRKAGISKMSSREEELRKKISELENQQEIRHILELEKKAFILRGEIGFDKKSRFF